MTAPSGESDDANLVATALAGDDRAFTSLMHRHKDTLYRFVRAHVGDADEAYDLVQEAFVAAWSALESYDGRPMGAWLRRIALNKCRDWGRRRTVRRFFFGAAPLDEALAATLPEIARASDDGIDDAALERLDAAIAALPNALKEPLILTVYDSLSHSEAGIVLGISAKAVETRVYRARQALAKTLRKIEGPSEG